MEHATQTVIVDATIENDTSDGSIRKCEECSVTFGGGRYTRFCGSCRAVRQGGKKKYFFTERMDEAIRKAYAERADLRTSTIIPNLTELATKWNMPKHEVTKRGKALGLARTKESPWSEAELKILHEFAWMSIGRISIKLKNRGFSRSETAVKLKLKRIGARRDANSDIYTARGLAECFGIDAHAITRWIKLGLLKAEHRGTDHKRDTWQIHENDVRTFIMLNPQEYDLRKVDQLWFLDMITNGKIGGY